MGSFFNLLIIFGLNLIQRFSSTVTEELIAVSPNDPSSFSNPEQIKADKIEIKWDVDFNKKILDGLIRYELTSIDPNQDKIIFDIRFLNIKNITDSTGQNVPYEIGPTYMDMGQPLTVNLLNLTRMSTENLKYEIFIGYETEPRSSALLWLEKEMTADNKSDFMFSQAALINARSLFPCQDSPSTKATYEVSITVPIEFVVLYAGQLLGQDIIENGTKKLFRYEQTIPVPSYLVAIAVGTLKSAVIGPRSLIWAEESVLPDAQFDFSDTESMIKAAESIVGPYQWSNYDILVLPFSYPFGGMENPCLTYVTPTLLTHDKSLAYVVAHEIAHSWTGNLVTHKTFEHFWVKEGPTVFLERKIVGILQGEEERQFESLTGWAELENTVKTLGTNSNLTKLVLNLTGIHPDDAYSSIPYEKGYVFMYYLESLVGHEEMKGFLRDYVEKFRYKSIDSFEFKDFFMEYFEQRGEFKLVETIDWNDWFFSPGMPKWKPSYNSSLYDACTLLSSRWISWDVETPNPFSKQDFDQFGPSQIQEFLTSLVAAENPLELKKIEIMKQTYEFHLYRNSEILFRWFRLGIKSRWLDQLPAILEFLTKVGRLKYIRPIYRDLYEWELVRQDAIDTFIKNRPYMIPWAARVIAIELHLEK